MKDSNTALNNASGSHDADKPKTMEVECEETSSAAAPHNKSVVCYGSASELQQKKVEVPKAFYDVLSECFYNAMDMQTSHMGLNLVVQYSSTITVSLGGYLQMPNSHDKDDIAKGKDHGADVDQGPEEGFGTSLDGHTQIRRCYSLPSDLNIEHNQRLERYFEDYDM